MPPTRAQRTFWISLGPLELHRVKEQSIKEPRAKVSNIHSTYHVPWGFSEGVFGETLL